MQGDDENGAAGSGQGGGLARERAGLLPERPPSELTATAPSAPTT
jgi:hypothetical protein